METWMKEYAKHLEDDMRKNPEEYMLKEYNHDKLKLIITRMKIAFGNRNYNKNTPSIKTTCKALGIKHTYTAINHFIANHK